MTTALVPLHQDPIVIAHARYVLQQMDEICRSLVYAAIVTDDGFVVVTRGRETDGGRFASMSSSVQALSDAVARELQIGLSKFVVIGSDHGHVIQQRVPGQGLVLAAHFDVDETLGKALSTTRLTAERMGDYLTGAARPA